MCQWIGELSALIHVKDVWATLDPRPDIFSKETFEVESSDGWSSSFIAFAIFWGQVVSRWTRIGLLALVSQISYVLEEARRACGKARWSHSSSSNFLWIVRSVVMRCY